MANDHRADPLGRKQKDRSFRFYAAIVIGVLALILIFQNSQKVDFKFFFLEGQTPLFFGLIIAFALGALVGWLLPHVRRGGKRHEDEKKD